MQRRFIGLLNAILADMAGAGVVGDVDLFHVALADPSDVAEHMGGLHVVRIVPQQLGLDVDPGKPVPMHRELSGLVLAEIDPDRHAVEAPLALFQTPEAFQVLLADLDHLGQLGQGLRPVRRPARG